MPTSIMARSDITSTAKIVYAAILDLAGKNGEAWPTIERMVEECGSTKCSVIRAVRLLEDMELLAVNRQHRANNLYTILGIKVRPVGYQSGTQDGIKMIPKNNKLGYQNDTSRVSKCDPIGYQNDTPYRLSNQTQIQTKKKPSLSENQKMKIDPWSQATAAMTSDILRSPGFEAAWRRWVAYRIEIKKSLKPTTTSAQIRKLEKFGHDAAIQAIERSIENGWTGLFEPDEEKQRSPARPRPPKGKYDGIEIEIKV